MQLSIKKTLFGYLFLLVGLAITSCQEPAKPSCRATFEKYYEVNVEAFMKTAPSNVDSATARKVGECMLNKLYEIDSTFVLMKGKELNDFIRKNSAALQQCKCDSLDWPEVHLEQYDRNL